MSYDNPRISHDEKGFLFIWEKDPEPPEGPPTPIYGELEWHVGPWRVLVSDSGEAWVYDLHDEDEEGITIRPDDDFTAVLDAIADMRKGPFPVVGWRTPDMRWWGPESNIPDW